MTDKEAAIEQATESMNGLAVSDDRSVDASTSGADAEPRENAGSSPETEHQSPTGNSSSTDSQNNSSARLTAKFLMSNQAAGSIIGKNGTNITELQTKSGARLQLSRTNEFFPGTQDRVLIVTGTIEQISAALSLVMNTVDPELVVEARNGRNGTDDRKHALRFLMPSATCGVLIGRGGMTIRALSKDSGASIAVSAVMDQLPGVSDRTTLISGTKDQILEAISLVLQKLKQSPHYNRLATVPVNYNGFMGWPQGQFQPQMGPVAMPPHHPMANGHMPPAPHMMAGQSEVMIPVPDSRIGAIIGRGGEIITQLKNVVNVRIRVSNRDVFVPGTKNRKVIVTGNPEAVHIASQLIHQKVAAAGQNPVPQNGANHQ